MLDHLLKRTLGALGESLAQDPNIYTHIFFKLEGALERTTRCAQLHLCTCVNVSASLCEGYTTKKLKRNTKNKQEAKNQKIQTEQK